MIDSTKRSLVAFLVAAATPLALAPATLARAAPGGPGPKLQLHQPALETHRYLVVLHEGADADALARSLAADYGIDVSKTWRRGLRGFLAEADREAAERLAADPRVRFVEQDVELGSRQLRAAEGPGLELGLELKGGTAVPPRCFDAAGNVNLGVRLNPYPIGSSAVQWGPDCPDVAGCIGNWGLDRIDQRAGLDGSYAPVAGPYEVDVFVVDSGIPLGHFELGGVVVDEIEVGPGDPDPYFHGTHVAGIVAGMNFGVARQNLRLVSLNAGQPASISGVVAAFEALFGARRQEVPAVATVSLNGTGVRNSRSLAEVVRRAIAERVTVINSAGNVTRGEASLCPAGGASANLYSMVGGIYPGEVILVAASDDGDGLYCECDTPAPGSDCASRTGTAVDLFAPGADIVSMSALANDAVCVLSGTSMAAPHAAGAAALFLSRFPQASPSVVQKALRRSATPSAVPGAGSGGRLLYVGSYTSNAPMAGHQYLTARAGEVLWIPFADLLADDVDWNGRTLTVTGVSSPVGGTVEVVGGNTAKFTVGAQTAPSTATLTTAYFTYTITNGLRSDTARVRIVVLPGAADDEVVFAGTAAPRRIAFATLLANDGGGAALTECPALDTSATAGTVTPRASGGGCAGYDYTPPSTSFRGTDSFRYAILGGLGQATVTVRWNDPDFPTPPAGPVVGNYPGHVGTGQVTVPGGAYLLSWTASDHTGITEYELIEEQNGASQVIYRGPETFYAVSGRSNGTRIYTARACTPSACSQPSQLSNNLNVFVGSSAVKTVLAGCSHYAACNPRRGLWYDPARSGNGIDLQRGGDGRRQLMLFTYRQEDATPIWYRAQPGWIVGACPQGVAASYCMVSALEEVRSTGPATPFGFAVLSPQSTQAAALRVYAFEDPALGSTGFEDLLFTSTNFRLLAGENQGATGNWQPTAADGTGLVITQLPPEYGYVKAFATVYFFRPDGSPTWVTTRSGTIITYPWSRYYGTAYLLHRRGINLCLACTGAWSWDDTNVPGYARMDVIQPLSSTTGTVRVTVPIGSGVDPAFPGGYSHFYLGGIRKTTPP